MTDQPVRLPEARIAEIQMMLEDDWELEPSIVRDLLSDRAAILRELEQKEARLDRIDKMAMHTSLDDILKRPPEGQTVTELRLFECIVTLRYSKQQAEAALARLTQERDRLREALVKVRAHTSYTVPASGKSADLIALLSGLLGSVERITETALASLSRPAEQEQQ